MKPGPEVFVEILARGGVLARMDTGGVLGPGRSQGLDSYYDIPQY